MSDCCKPETNRIGETSAKNSSGGEEIELGIGGMTCSACALHVSRALQGVAGNAKVNVPDWKAGRAIVMLPEGVQLTDEVLVAAVAEAGYQASVQSRRTDRSTTKSSSPLNQDDWGVGADYDLVVIGTGGGGMAAAIKAAEMGKSVCIVEKGTIGGTCVNIGCVPSKTLIRAAEAYHKAGHQPFKGVYTKAEGLDWKTVIGQKDELVQELRQAKYDEVLDSYAGRIRLKRFRARLQPSGVVALDNGHTFKARKIVVATGARPSIPQVEGIENVNVLTSTSVMNLPQQPRSLIVIGGRFIALELGQVFARFGTQVTILQRSSRLIPEHEPEISEALAGYLREEGMTIHTGVRLQRIREQSGEKVVTIERDGQQQEFRAEHVLMATGRTPNTEDLGLEDVGVELDPQGFIVVDEHMRTMNPHIYAAGDVTNRPKLVYVAAAAGGIAAENALNGNSRKLDLSVLPDVIFTDPQVATVGMTELQATELGYRVEVSILPLKHVPRALAARDTRGLIKLIAEAGSGRLLGAHVLAAEGGEIIQAAALAVKFGAEFGFTYRDLTSTLFPYLVQVEGLKLAALTFNKDVGKLSCCAG